MNIRSRGRALFALAVLVFLLVPGCARKGAVPDVFVAKDASWYERTAAAEVRRYLFLRTGMVPALR
jgi:hypothetical protein